MAQPPYDQLYIYELAGDARPWAKDLGPDYLGLWLEGSDSFLFFSQPAEGAVDRLLAGSDLRLRQRHHLSYEQWQGGLKMEPLHLEGLSLVPAWAPAQAKADQPLIRLDPGLVFGNGLHPTTRHCLELLVELARLGPLGRVLDLGCGTGILALAAAALGAREVVAVDLNPLCVSTTQGNAALNELELIVLEGPAQENLARPAEVLLANLHWEVMEALLGQVEDLAGKQELILSGLLRSQRRPLEDRLAALGFQIHRRREAQGTWFTLWARRGRPGTEG